LIVAAVVTSTGLMLVFGGKVDSNTASINELWSYNISANSWQLLGTSSTAVIFPAAIYVPNSIIIYGGDPDPRGIIPGILSPCFLNNKGLQLVQYKYMDLESLSLLHLAIASPVV
jgi:hypothetical protein